MKKVLSLILATLLVLTSVAAVAEALPSKTTEDIIVVNEAVAENGAVEITVVESTEAKVAETLATVVETILSKEEAVAVYTEDTQAAIAAKVGDAELELNEIVAIAAPAYEAENGAVTAKFTFPTVYTAEQKLVAVVTVYTADVAEEIVLDAAADAEGAVTVTFTAEAMAKIAAADVAILAILNTK